MPSSVAHTVEMTSRSGRRDDDATQPIATGRRTKHYPALAIVSGARQIHTRDGSDATASATARKAGMRVSFRVLPDPKHVRSVGTAERDDGLRGRASGWRLP